MFGNKCGGTEEKEQREFVYYRTPTGVHLTEG